MKFQIFVGVQFYTTKIRTRGNRQRTVEILLDVNAAEEAQGPRLLDAWVLGWEGRG